MKVDAIASLAPPFAEHASVRDARHLAERLAASRLAIYVTGEPGTGRRTLARAVGALREADSLVELDGDARELASGERPGVLIVHRAEWLDARIQARIAGWIVDGTRMSAWGAPGFLDSAEPELAVHLRSGVVTLPPIRERGDDVVEWARLFVRERSEGAISLASDAANAVARHSWPGNLVELASAIDRALALRERSAGGSIGAHELGLAPADSEIIPLATALDRFRREYVERALEKFGGNRSRTARALEIDPRTIFRYLEKSADEESDT